MFQLVWWGKVTLSEAWDAPVMFRHWWFDRIQKEREAEANRGKSPGRPGK